MLGSLPTVLGVTSATLTIDARRLPSIWFLWPPPLLTFVSFVTTAPFSFVVSTAHTLRVATVARPTGSGGPFIIAR